MRLNAFFVISLLIALSTTSALASSSCVSKSVFCSPTFEDWISNELINEKHDVKFLQLTKVNVSSEFQVFKFNGYRLDTIRNLSPEEKKNVVNLLVANATSTTQSVAASYGAEPSVTVGVNETSLQSSATGPIIVYAWAEFEMQPSFLGFRNSNFPNGWTLEDIACGLLNAGLNLKMPVTLHAQAGHNVSVSILKELQSFPANIVVTDERFQPAGGFKWSLINWDGNAKRSDSSHAVRMFASKEPVQSGDVRGRFYADIYSIKFVSRGDELTFNISLSLSLFTATAKNIQSIKGSLSQIFIIEYMPSDILRLFYALHSNGCLNFSVDSYLDELHSLMDTNLANVFQAEVHTKMEVDWSTFTRPIEIMNMTGSEPINVNFSVGNVKKLLERKVSFSAFKILSIRRTFSITIPSMRDYDCTMDYTFKFPENIKVLNVSCPGHNTGRDIDLDRRWIVTVRTEKTDDGSTLTVIFGADLEYDFAPLTPYLVIIVALLTVWVIVTILAYRKGKSGRRKRRE